MTLKELEANYYKEAERKQMELAKKKSQRRYRWWLALQAVIFSVVICCSELFDWNYAVSAILIMVVLIVAALPFTFDLKGGSTGKTKKNQQVIDSCLVVPNYTNHS